MVLTKDCSDSAWKVYKECFCDWAVKFLSYYTELNSTSYLRCENTELVCFLLTSYHFFTISIWLGSHDMFLFAYNSLSLRFLKELELAGESWRFQLIICICEPKNTDKANNVLLQEPHRKMTSKSDIREDIFLIE